MAKSPDKRSKAKDGDENAFLSLMRKRVEMAWNDQRANSEEAADDLLFATGEGQWDADIKNEREAEGRPCLTFNLVLQFCRQVTGDMRQSRPAIKAYGVDDDSDPEIARALSEVVRHIENRSDAKNEYFKAADNQVMAGLGYLRIETEQPSKKRSVQEMRVTAVRDPISVLDDPDARMPGKLDRRWAFIPLDMEFETFKERYPNAKTSGFGDLAKSANTISSGANGEFWRNGNKIRVGEYFTRDENDKVMRYVVTDVEVLEEGKEIPSRFIPLVPVIGEEIYVGPRIYRFGKVRHLKAPARALNYWLSAETEAIALQPKAPFIVTEDNVKEYPEWGDANRRNLPYLRYKPDAKNGGARPERSQPPMASQGISVAVERAVEMMRQVSGIYDASLGARSNENSGVAIRARQQEGDTGTFVYPSNFATALQQLGRIMIDMIPRVYDTSRVLRIIGEDGAVNEVPINRPVSIDPEAPAFANDLSVGEYDVVVEVGPSYSTKREEARDGMNQMINANPAVFALIGDLYAKGQDWPMADKMAERLRQMLPPAIKKLEDQEAGERGQPTQPPQPDPQEVAAMQAQQMAMEAEMALKAAEVATKQAQARKAEADAAKAEIEAQAAVATAMQPPAASMPAQDDPRVLELQNAVLDMREALQEVSGAVEQLAGAVVEIAGPMPEPPPDEMAGAMPMDQPPPPEGGFLMSEQPGAAPQL